ncbi:GDP-mannose 4,6-dehydratase [bacterium]|nr:GDP-mannose 4,6-dehydratase [bacterium]NDC93958.1 GDP-mannose 4,6-dehydratase [bacterium]NDD83453.1 GDP-mannose 4,6-dehydratase [bacterium]NDG29078.1 GDP-mannose 4,6-dehydratase [bacterium]
MLASRKVALIIGCNGMDGSLMCDLLLSKGYEVHGIIRRASNFNTQRLEHIFHKMRLHYGDVTDAMSLLRTIQLVEPDEIYNFAAQSHVKVSCELENYTFQANTIGVLNVLQAVKTLGFDKRTKVYIASTSETFGNVTDGTTLLTEKTEMLPVSPYGISKLAAYHLSNYYRDAFGMFVVSSVLLNHEGPRRGHTFVTQKIAQHVGKYYKLSGKISPLQLGNLNAKRDWGNAEDYVYGVYLMLQHHTPDNYILATGEEHSVREFVELAFSNIGVIVHWEGERERERGLDNTGKVLVEVNPKYYRPIDIHHLVGDYSKAKNVLGWEPKTSFPELVKLMVDAACSRN